MLNIFDFNNYKDFVNKWVSSQPKRGYGQFRKMAEFLQVGTVLVSQVFRGDRQLSEEQALDLVVYLGLLEQETKYFLGLVRLARASSKKLRTFIQSELDQLIQDKKELKKIIASDIQLDEISQAKFYSDWYYSALRLATDIPQLRSLSRLSERLDLPIDKVKAAVEFLLESGLCEMKNGEIQMGPKIVYLPADSPYVVSRQRGWRVKAFQKMDSAEKESLFFTCPLVCSQKTAEGIRMKIVHFIENILTEVKDSPSEDLVCLNIDWFRV